MPWLAAPLIGGLFGWLSNRKSKSEKNAMAANAEATRRGMEMQEELQPLRMDYLQKGQGAMGGALDYWSKILSGRDSATSLLSPEINQITQGYRGARTASRTLNPRGGGSSAMTRRIEEEVIPGQIGGLLATARPRAAGEVSTLGTNMSQIGTSLAGVESGLLGGAGSNSGNLLNYGLRDRAQQYTTGAGIGRSMFDIYKYFNKGKGTPDISGLAGGIPGFGTNPRGSTGYNFLSPGPTGPSASLPTYRRPGNSWGL